MKKRLSKALAAAGIASRRAAEELIFEGRVKVNGKIVTVAQTLVDSKEDRIEINGKRIKEENKVYYLLNKPAGYICSNSATLHNCKLVVDLFKERTNKRLFTIGRLDKDTTGLIIVTNDGYFANRVIHPSFGITKEYIAKVDQEIKIEHLKGISEGIYIDGTKVIPKVVKKVRRGTLKIVIGEGKNREVRQLLEKVGLTIKDLTRVRIGGLHLGKLPLGAFRELSLNEIDDLTQRAEYST